jgi:phosphoenolpyruvate-protein phosphotransferase (PTS system enzyme I)
VKRIMRQASRAEAVSMLEAAMQFSTAEEIERYIRAEMDKRFSENP